MIFGIGLARTGTKSLSEALNILGYHSNHYRVMCDALRFNAEGYSLDYRMLGAFEAYTDSPVALTYPLLDRHFNGSTFILTVREQESWLRSCEIKFKVPKNDKVARLHEILYNSACFNADRWREAYCRHVEGVFQHFKGRNNLLVMNIVSGDGWDKLCPFLGKEIPTGSFPKSNTTLGAR